MDKPLSQALRITGLSTFAFAAPIYGVLARHPEFFQARQAGLVELLVLVVALSVLPPVALVVVARLACARGAVWGIRVHHGIFFCLWMLIALPFLNKLPVALGYSALVGAALAGAGATWAMARWPSLGEFVSYGCVAVVAFPVVFLFNLATSASPPDPSEIPDTALVNPPPIVMLVFDELPTSLLVDRAFAIDATHYPNLAALSAHSTWFRNATTVSDDTLRGAMPAIVTGRYPDREAIGDNLITWLSHHYRLNISTGYTALCPESLCPGLLPFSLVAYPMLEDAAIIYLHIVTPPRLARRLPAVGGSWKYFREATRVRLSQYGSKQRPDLLREGGRVSEFLEFTEGFGSSMRPGLHLAHILFPHVPWIFSRCGDRYDVADTYYGMLGMDAMQRWGSDPWPATDGYFRHMLQMEFTDRLIGTALRRLREAGSYDDALIIVTADHGVSFRAGGYRRRLDASNAADIMPVPLLIKRPHQKEPAIDDRNAEIVDIVPTVAGVLGVEVPWDVDGVSLFGPDPKRPGKRAFQQHSSPTSQVFNGPPSVLEMIVKEVERRDRLFEDLHNPVAISGHANLHPGVGQRLPETATQRSDLLTLEIGSRQSPAREEPACDGLQPISGSVAIGGPVGSPIVLAVSVNGVVRTYTRAIPTSESSASFVAFLEAPHAQLETVGVHLIGAGVGEVTTLRLRK